MGWFFSIIRIAGASFPGASSLVQLQSEIDSIAFSKRFDKLEDPISYLHSDVPELSKLIYQELKTKEKLSLSFSREFYSEYSRSLAALESEELISGQHAIKERFRGGIYLCDPSFIMYLSLSEDNNKMEKLIKLVDACEVGQRLEGEDIKKDLDLPLPVIKAVFDIYESNGYGFCSKTHDVNQYIGKA